MVEAAVRFGGGLMLGLVLMAFGQPSYADVEDVVIPAPRPIFIGIFDDFHRFSMVFHDVRDVFFDFPRCSGCSRLFPARNSSAQVDDKGKTTTLTKEQLVRGKRLFIATCASCHVGGGTQTPGRSLGP